MEKYQNLISNKTFSATELADIIDLAHNSYIIKEYTYCNNLEMINNRHRFQLAWVSWDNMRFIDYLWAQIIFYDLLDNNINLSKIFLNWETNELKYPLKSINKYIDSRYSPIKIIDKSINVASLLFNNYHKKYIELAQELIKKLLIEKLNILINNGEVELYQGKKLKLEKWEKEEEDKKCNL